MAAGETVTCSREVGYVVTLRNHPSRAYSTPGAVRLGPSEEATYRTRGRWKMVAREKEMHCNPKVSGSLNISLVSEGSNLSGITTNGSCLCFPVERQRSNKNEGAETVIDKPQPTTGQQPGHIKKNENVDQNFDFKALRISL